MADSSQQPYTQAIQDDSSSASAPATTASPPTNESATQPLSSSSELASSSSEPAKMDESTPSSFPVASTSTDVVVDPPRLATVGAPAAAAAAEAASKETAAASSNSTSTAEPASVTVATPSGSSSISANLIPGEPIIITHLPDGTRAPIVAHASGFAATRAVAASHPNPQPYVEPPPYNPAIADSSLTGVAKDSHPIRISLNSEEDKMRPEQKHALIHAKTPELLMREDEVMKLDAATLKKMGLGRTPSGYCYSSRMTMHQQLPAVAKGELHPEQPARITGIFNNLNEAGFLGRMERIAVREAIKDEIVLVHSPAHFDRVRATGFQTPEYLETCSEYFDRLSLYVNPDTALCARLSCGGVIEMCGAVAEGKIRNGFAIVRPPGHHAEPEDAMGFCFFNNVAVAAKWLRTVYDDGSAAASSSTPANGLVASSSTPAKKKRMDKILILDWDVHHGNGTQKAFWDDPNVLYMSLHRHDGMFYPGGTYGSAEAVGDGEGKGFSVNVPFPHTGMGDADYIYAFQQIIMPIAYEFQPDMVLVSAGYDAADGDELGQMRVTPAGFAHMTHLLSVLADGKLVLALEGGYNVESVVKSAHACVEVLVGDEPRRLDLGAASQSATNVVQEVKRVQSKYWKSLGYSAEPVDEAKEAGKVIPLAEMLKSHRVYELYHDYELYNVELVDEELEEMYRDQLLISSDVYECETLVIFMHDIGSMKASYTAATLDVELEKTTLIDTSREVFDWALNDNGFGLIDVNLLAHTVSTKGQIIAPDQAREVRKERELALFVWDQIAGLSTATNIVLFGMGAGCRAMLNILQERQSVRERVRACIEIIGLEYPPELGADSGIRGWFKEKSLVMLPSTHPLHEDARKAGKHQKKYGNVFRALQEDEGRPIHLLRASMPKIKEFVRDRLPAPTRPVKVKENAAKDSMETDGVVVDAVSSHAESEANAAAGTGPSGEAATMANDPAAVTTNVANGDSTGDVPMAE